MDKKIENVFGIVEERILEHFPSVNVEIEHDKEREEYFISIDDSDIYHSESFQLLITELSFEVIWPAHIPGVFFTYEKQYIIENWSINFFQGSIYEINYDDNQGFSLPPDGIILNITGIQKAA